MKDDASLGTEMSGAGRCVADKGTARPREARQPPRPPPAPPTRARAHLIVQVQVVELPVGAEVLRAPVQGEVNAPALAFDDHRVPMVVVQQTSGRHRCVAVDGAKLVAS